jgi:hypothetical protein
LETPIQMFRGSLLFPICFFPSSGAAGSYASYHHCVRSAGGCQDEKRWGISIRKRGVDPAACHGSSPRRIANDVRFHDECQYSVTGKPKKKKTKESSTAN